MSRVNLKSSEIIQCDKNIQQLLDCVPLSEVDLKNLCTMVNIFCSYIYLYLKGQRGFDA